MAMRVLHGRSEFPTLLVLVVVQKLMYITGKKLHLNPSKGCKKEEILAPLTAHSSQFPTGLPGRLGCFVCDSDAAPPSHGNGRIIREAINIAYQFPHDFMIVEHASLRLIPFFVKKSGIISTSM